jgi:hypothetical protein
VNNIPLEIFGLSLQAYDAGDQSIISAIDRIAFSVVDLCALADDNLSKVEAEKLCTQSLDQFQDAYKIACRSVLEEDGSCKRSGFYSPICKEIECYVKVLAEDNDCLCKDIRDAEKNCAVDHFYVLKTALIVADYENNCRPGVNTAVDNWLEQNDEFLLNECLSGEKQETDSNTVFYDNVSTLTNFSQKGSFVIAKTCSENPDFSYASNLQIANLGKGGYVTIWKEYSFIDYVTVWHGTIYDPLLNEFNALEIKPQIRAGFF